MSFPDEPDWESVDEETLIQLIENFEDEQSCATSAIIYLASLNQTRCWGLASWLVEHPASDQWLKAAARDALESSLDTEDHARNSEPNRSK